MYISTGEQLKTWMGQILSRMNYPDRLSFQNILSGIISPLLKKKGLTPEALNQKKSASLNNFQKQQANKFPSRG